MFMTTLFVPKNLVSVFSSMVTYLILSKYYIKLQFTHMYYFAV